MCQEVNNHHISRAIHETPHSEIHIHRAETPRTKIIKLSNESDDFRVNGGLESSPSAKSYVEDINASDRIITKKIN